MKINSLTKALLIAKQIFNNKDRVKDVFEQSKHKAEENKERMNSGLWGDVMTLKDMLRAFQAGTYKFSKRTIIYVIGGLLYFVSPIDAIPDFILGIGFIDDAAVLALVIKRIRKEITRFKQSTSTSEVRIIS